MTEPFVTTEYGVSELSGKQKGSERLGVTKHYPHSCWLYEQQWCTPFLPPSPSHLLLLSFYPLLHQSPPPHPTHARLPLVTTKWCCSSPVCAILKTTNPFPPPNHCHHQLFHPSPPPLTSSPHTTILAISEGLDKDLYSITHIEGGGGGTLYAHKYRVTPRLKIQ